MVTAAGFYPTGKQLISQHAFHVVIWFGVGLCAAVCILRFWIRFFCFRRLYVEDFLMLGAMAVLIASASVLQTYLGDIYDILRVQNGEVAPTPDFLNSIPRGLRANFLSLFLDIVGLWAIKFNFMLLFYRLGNQIQSYLIIWRTALVLVISCGVASIGLIPYNCLLGSVQQLTVKCATAASVQNIYTHYIASVVIDIFSDLVLIAFPIMIIWNTGLDWRQKLMLSSIFLLVGFTIAVTVVRGTIFGGDFKSVTKVDREVMDSSWMLFWWYIEYVVSFVIACLVSFRSLWSSQEERSRKRRVEAERQRMIMEIRERAGQSNSNENSQRTKWQKMSDGLLFTFAHMEGSTIYRDDKGRLQLESHLATMDLDFSEWQGDSDSRNTVDKPESIGDRLPDTT
ncbi:unnamed protein product [Periconia digitata]|uniref:Rhodopsin domain-containing protein n=1 Tax=Periconia digitata TaxID=1303443 RepID=A0A9W4UC08_9PLEO|nr:unnamed protein product [Periconia digitata]